MSWQHGPCHHRWKASNKWKLDSSQQSAYLQVQHSHCCWFLCLDQPASCVLHYTRNRQWLPFSNYEQDRPQNVGKFLPITEILNAIQLHENCLKLKTLCLLPFTDKQIKTITLSPWPRQREERWTGSVNEYWIWECSRKVNITEEH